MNLIVMQESIKIKGSDGNFRWFLAGRQYTFIEVVEVVNQCQDCDRIFKNRLMKHAKVVYGEEYFLIPQYACVVYNTVIPEDKQNKIQYEYDQAEDKTSDMVKAAYEILGLVIDNEGSYDINDRRYNETVEKTNEDIARRRSTGIAPDTEQEEEPGMP